MNQSEQTPSQLAQLQSLCEPAPFQWDCLQNELAAITPEARQKLHHEISGLQPDIQETHALISSSLEALEIAIDSIEEKEAYETALFVDPVNIQDDSYRLAFLRADRFDVDAAAQRIVKYWDRKVELFGADIAFKVDSDILDLKVEDYQALIKGGIQILPNRDEFGRLLVFMCLNDFENNVDSMVRYHWVLLNMAVFDAVDGDHNQRKGMVLLTTSDHQNSGILPFESMTNMLKIIRNFANDVDCIPFKHVATHVVVPNFWMLKFTEHVLFSMGASIRQRVVLHTSGNTSATLTRLHNCGISAGRIPTVMGGRLDFNYKHWLGEHLYALTNTVFMEEDGASNTPNLMYLWELLPELEDPDFFSD
mmetsp:Transcript_27829/g.39154  ORF Transcript_27829/g.39154 Transcript_27829/m.39154 type:complete len:364 (+) Transcript_27829:42-1133(+)